jgi:biotin-(acetyl-CoA carboxylase) ligase
MLKKQSNFYGVQTLTKKNERPVTLVKEFLCELENILHMINLDQNKKIVNMWTKRSSTIGKKIAYMTDNGKKIGKVIKMDHDGALVISSNKKRERLIVGDISYKN